MEHSGDRDSFAPVFVGREVEKAEIKRLLRDGARLLLLHGAPLVGKASLAQQVARDECQRSRTRGDSCIRLCTADCSNITDWPGVMDAIHSALSFVDETSNDDEVNCWQGGQTAATTLLLLLKLNIIDSHSHHTDEFMRFVGSLATDVTILVTSRRRFGFMSTFEVKPLSQVDALSYLRHLTKSSDDNGDYGAILQYCHGLPPLIRQVAHLLQEDSMFTCTTEDLKQALAENPDMVLVGLEAEARQQFFGLSPEVQGLVTTLAHLLDGTFSTELLQAATGLEDWRVKRIQRRMRDEACVIVDESSRRMRVHPLSAYYAKLEVHSAPSVDPARLRLLSFIGGVLQKAERDLFTMDENSVQDYVQGEWPQLQKLLRQTAHCSDNNTYHAYLKLGLEAGTLLARCFPNESCDFFRDMADVAVQYGTPQEHAELRGLMGLSMLLSVRTASSKDALDCFRSVLPTLRKLPGSRTLPLVLCYSGVCSYRLNQLGDAERYLREAVKACETTSVDYERTVYILIVIRVTLALTITDKGRLIEAKDLILETLDMCDAHAPFHVQRSTLMNNLGVVYENSEANGQSEAALRCYSHALSERRRYAKTVRDRVNLAIPLHNMAMMYCRKGDYRNAFKCSEEALEIMGGACHYYTGLVLSGMGRICLRSGEYNRAERHLLRAADVYSVCTPGNDAFARVALTLAHLYVTSQRLDVHRVKSYLSQVCELYDSRGGDQSRDGLLFALTAAEHRMQLAGWNVTHNELLITWALQHLGTFRGDKSTNFPQHLTILEYVKKIGPNASCEEKDHVTSQVLDQCPVCKTMGTKDSVQKLWTDVETKMKQEQNVLTFLTGSTALTKALESEGDSGDDTHPSKGGHSCGRTTVGVPTLAGMTDGTQQTMMGTATQQTRGKLSFPTKEWILPLVEPPMARLSRKEQLHFKQPMESLPPPNQTLTHFESHKNEVPLTHATQIDADQSLTYVKTTDDHSSTDYQSLTPVKTTDDHSSADYQSLTHVKTDYHLSADYQSLTHVKTTDDHSSADYQSLTHVKTTYDHPSTDYQSLTHVKEFDDRSSTNVKEYKESLEPTTGNSAAKDQSLTDTKRAMVRSCVQEQSRRHVTHIMENLLQNEQSLRHVKHTQETSLQNEQSLTLFKHTHNGDDQQSTNVRKGTEESTADTKRPRDTRRYTGSERQRTCVARYNLTAHVHCRCDQAHSCNTCSPLYVKSSTSVTCKFCKCSAPGPPLCTHAHTQPVCHIVQNTHNYITNNINIGQVKGSVVIAATEEEEEDGDQQQQQ